MNFIAKLYREVFDKRAAGRDRRIDRDGAKLYLDLLKKCVSNSIYDDDFDLMRGKIAVDTKTGNYASSSRLPSMRGPSITAGSGPPARIP